MYFFSSFSSILNFVFRVSFARSDVRRTSSAIINFAFIAYPIYYYYVVRFTLYSSVSVSPFVSLVFGLTSQK